jgi:hypothetical protein
MEGICLKKVTVWVQAFQDRGNLVLQWHDPDTGRRKSKSARTNDPKRAEDARAELEHELNHGRYQEASRANVDDAVRQAIRCDPRNTLHGTVTVFRAKRPARFKMASRTQLLSQHQNNPA